MFLRNSRYADLPTVTTKTEDGRSVTALKLRSLPDPGGVPHEVKDNDQLDIIAQDRYKDPTRFWHIADANTELEASTLLEPTGRIIAVPES